MEPTRLTELLDGYLDGGLTPEDQRELEELLRQSPEARQEFWRATRFHATLREWGEQRRGWQWATVAEGRSRARFAPRRWLVAVVSLAVGALLTAGAWWWSGSRPVALPGTPIDPPSSVDPTETTTDAVAVLAETIGVVWSGDQPGRAVGQLLSPGELAIDAGLLWLEFRGGATVVVEGPAWVTLVNAARLDCSGGRLTVEVPSSAQGLTIGGRQYGVVQPNTALGVLVPTEGVAQWHVFRGAAEIGRPDSGVEPRRLTSGQGLIWDEEPPRSLVADAAAFVQATELPERAADRLAPRIAAWQAAVAPWAEDPALVAWYRFEPETSWDRRLINHAPNAPEESHGSLVGCQWTEGRWPGKQALDFKRPTDRVRMDLPGEFEAISMMAWVRVDALPNPFNSLLLTDGFDLGELHWQIRDQGFLQVGIADRHRTPANHDTDRILGPEWFGQWTHLAIVCDGPNGRLTHWVNGQPVAELPLGRRPPYRLGPCELGNWQPDDLGTWPIRNFNGRVDEFLIVGRALTTHEVEGHYQSGRPDAAVAIAHRAAPSPALAQRRSTSEPASER